MVSSTLFVWTLVTLLVSVGIYSPVQSNLSLLYPATPPYKYTHGTDSSAGKVAATRNETLRALLVIAHPDDEALFFAPTLLALTGSSSASLSQKSITGAALPLSPNNTRENDIHVLCLSNGNAEGFGKTRALELERSLDLLGVAESKRKLIESADLQDSMTSTWRPDAIAAVVRPYISRNRINAVLTFDAQGITQHANHASLLAGVSMAVKALGSSDRPKLFNLVTLPLFARYISFISSLQSKLDVYVEHIKQAVYTFALIKLAEMDGTPAQEPHQDAWLYTTDPDARLVVFVSGVTEYWRGVSAMLEHKSQLLWFRYLNVLTSRYMWVNEWREVKF